MEEQDEGRNYSNITTAINNLTAGGHQDWRKPTPTEVQNHMPSDESEYDESHLESFLGRYIWTSEHTLLKATSGISMGNGSDPFFKVRTLNMRGLAVRNPSS